MSSVGTLTSIAQGKCSAHKRTKTVTVMFLTGASSVLTNTSPTLNMTSIGVASCGHPVLVVTGSGTVFAESSGVVRVGDVVMTVGGTQIVLTGSSDTFAG